MVQSLEWLVGFPCTVPQIEAATDSSIEGMYSGIPPDQLCNSVELIEQEVANRRHTGRWQDGLSPLAVMRTAMGVHVGARLDCSAEPSDFHKTEEVVAEAGEIAEWNLEHLQAIVGALSEATASRCTQLGSDGSWTMEYDHRTVLYCWMVEAVHGSLSWMFQLF